MGDFSFDLIDQPWLPVTYTNGTRTHVGIRTALYDAPAIRAVSAAAGPSHQLNLALTRFLMAVYADFYRTRVAELATMEDLFDMWRQPMGPADLDTYLADHRDRFDLFHPTAPFYQTPGLDQGANPKTVGVMMPHVATGNTQPWFNLATNPMLTPAEAAQWLVHVHAYDTGGTLTPYQGKNTAGNRRGPLTYFVCALVTGHTLADTLLLNTTLGSSGGTPPWRRTPPPPHRVDDAAVEGSIDMLTWQSRRILLLPETGPDGGAVVRSCVRTGGDQFPITGHAWASHDPGALVGITPSKKLVTPEWKDPAFRMLDRVLPSEPPMSTAPPAVQQTAYALGNHVMQADDSYEAIDLTAYTLDPQGGSYRDAHHARLPVPAKDLVDWAIASSAAG